MRSRKGAALADRLGDDLRCFAVRWAAPRAAPTPPWTLPALAIFLLATTAAEVLAGAFLDPRDPPLFATFGRQWRPLFEQITKLGLSGYIFAIAGAVCLFALLRRSQAAPDKFHRARLGLLAGQACFVITVNAVAGLAAQALKHIAGRARPRLFAALGPYHFELFTTKARLASLPSGHTVTVFATAAALGFLVPKLRIPLYAIAVLVAFSRLLLLQHYPSDVIAGAALGWATARLLAYAFARRRIVFEMSRGRLRARGLRAISSGAPLQLRKHA